MSLRIGHRVYDVRTLRRGELVGRTRYRMRVRYDDGRIVYLDDRFVRRGNPESWAHFAKGHR